MTRGMDLHWHTLGAHLLQVDLRKGNSLRTASPHGDSQQAASWQTDSRRADSQHADFLPADVASAECPLFYVSPLIPQFPDRPPRAGVPVMFPQFADRGAGPKHGIVRMVPWVSAGLDAWTLHVPPQPDQHWLGDAHLRVSAQIESGLGLSDASADATPQSSPHLQRAMRDAASASIKLTLQFEVENVGGDAFSFTGGLHPYYAVSDVTQLRIEGLDGVPFDDRYGAQISVADEFLHGQAFERLYLRADTLVMVDDARRVRMSATGFDNWMVWNPGIELAKGLPDLPDADWQRFVCIEPVCAGRAVIVAAGERFVGTVTLEQHVL